MIKSTLLILFIFGVAIGALVSLPARAATLPSYEAYPPNIVQQVAAQDVCLARWTWNDAEIADPFWEAPFAADATGLLDLRSIPQMSLTGSAPAEGWGLFAYNQPMGSTGMHCMGGDLDAAITTPQANTLGAILGTGNLRARNMRGAIKELLTDKADPTGQVFSKPVRISRESGFNIHLGGYGQIVDEEFSQAHPSFQSTLDVRWADYRRHRNAGVPIATLQKWTGYDGRRLFGRDPTPDDLTRLIPTEFLSDGSRNPETTIGDTFVEAVDTNINAHTATGPNGGFGWTILAGTGIVSETIDRLRVTSASTTLNVRADSDLSSDDNYAQYDSYYDVVANSENSVFTRKDSTSTITWYSFQADEGSGFYRLRKFIAGTATALVTDVTFDGIDADTIRIEADGSTITGKVNGSTKIGPATDTAITGNFRTGIRLRGDNNNNADNFEAADLAAAPTGAPTQQIILISSVMAYWSSIAQAMR